MLEAWIYLTARLANIQINLSMYGGGDGMLMLSLKLIRIFTLIVMDFRNQFGQLGGLERTSETIVLRPVRISQLCDVEVRALAAGGRHTLCNIGRSDTSSGEGELRKVAYETFAWGRGSDGELGTGNVKNESNPAVISILHGRFALNCLSIT